MRFDLSLKVHQIAANMQAKDTLQSAVHQNTLAIPEKLVLKVDCYRSEPMCMRLTKPLEEGRSESERKIVSMFLGNQDMADGRMPMYCAYLNAALPDYEVIKQQIVSQGLAEPVIRNGNPVISDNNVHAYPLYRFNADKLREMDPKGMEQYEHGYKMSSMIQQMADEARSNIMAEQNDVTSGGFWFD